MIEEEKLQQEKETSEQNNSLEGQQIRPTEKKESQAVILEKKVAENQTSQRTVKLLQLLHLDLTQILVDTFQPQWKEHWPLNGPCVEHPKYAF